MDISKEYILMCEKSKEIQENDGKKYNNIYYDINNEKIINSYDYINCSDKFLRLSLVWLPHQDQLQDIIKDKYIMLQDMILVFYDFSNSKYTYRKITGYTNQTIGADRAYYFNSMEQLWLAFVMKEKYNKFWNGTDWIKNGD